MYGHIMYMQRTHYDCVNYNENHIILGQGDYAVY